MTAETYKIFMDTCGDMIRAEIRRHDREVAISLLTKEISPEVVSEAMHFSLDEVHTMQREIEEENARYENFGDKDDDEDEDED